jgi:hypothetical protein
MVRTLVGLSLFCLTAPAYAALDDVVDTHAEVRAVSGHNVRVHAVDKVTDFADDHGRVFLTRWEGFHDLHALLGTHYDAYAAALPTAARGLHVVHVRTDELDVSIVTYGAYHKGSAVLLKQVPTGVKLNALR